MPLVLGFVEEGGEVVVGGDLDLVHLHDDGDQVAEEGVVALHA